KAIRGCDYVFNISGVLRPKKNIREYWDVNSEGAKNVAAACFEEKTKQLIHCSTVYVLGLPKKLPADESTEPNPFTAYDKSKLAGENSAIETGKKGLNVTVIRPGVVYGPGDTSNYLKVFKIVESGFFPLIGSGKNIFQLVFIENLLDAFEIVMGNKKAFGKVFIVADEKMLMRDFLEKMSKIMGKKLKIIVLPYWPMFLAGYFFDCLSFFSIKELPLSRSRVSFLSKDFYYSTKKIRALGWTQKTSLEEGLEKTIKWYKQHNLLG
ncbi:MAG: NAD-dependent epimerase/dehydratase family protein, partial [Candidatus ainarchaeum sp.]|nr:NAD-dependent epimerase/dehydratase family protein [Candidatus ainarchaeum sp.]